jgi:2-polyprenyl-6-methoxyphenol hydroxylase-like FAD-dependent oxidoreductase
LLALGRSLRLAGDAGNYKYPLSAQGLLDAFRDADLLSEAIDKGLALADYEQKRNDAVVPMYENTCMRALLRTAPARSGYTLSRAAQ